jgi:hypothetical protein
MYQCYLCGNFDSTITKFRAHLYRHHGLAELKMPILCRQGNCKAAFVKVYNCIRHIRNYHISDAVLDGDIKLPSGSGSHDTYHDDGDNVDADQTDNFASGIAESCIHDVQTQAVALVSSLRANSSIPYSIIPSVVDSFNHMATSLTNCVQNIAKSSLSEAGIDANTLRCKV